MTSIESFSVDELLELRSSCVANYSKILAILDFVLDDIGVDVGQPELPFYYPESEDTYCEPDLF